MSDRPAEQAHRVTPLELFLDLVMVFAITQVTTFLSGHPTWGGLLRGVLLLGVLWWAWSAYAWLTNTLDPEEGGVRIAVFAAIAAMLVVSLAAPTAFGDDGVVFGVAYFVVRAIHLLLFAVASRRDRDLWGAVVRTLPGTTLAPVLLIVAGVVHGTAQLALWGAALAVLYLSPLKGGMRGFRVSPEHFVERFGLIMIIALGESIVAIGVGAAGLPLDARLIAAALLGITVAACLWWSYFDWLIYVGQATLADATGAERAVLARDAYSYLHLPMVAGIVLFAFGLKTSLPHLSRSLPTLPALGLLGGIALYLLAHVALRLRFRGGLGRGRPIAAVVLLALLPMGRTVAALTALALVSVVCVCLIAYEALWHRQERAWIRSHRDGFTRAEADAVQPPRRRRRRRNGAGGGPAP
ncbi:MAG TPA: low temperature requirement protein A [Actinomycetota bacterium]|nr:low temperature requirement protein A [Actinomycetota bacterium]